MKDNKFFKKILRGDPVLWTVFLCLLNISLIEVFSASSSLSYDSASSYLSPIKSHCVMLMAGFGIAVAVPYIPVRYLKLMPIVSLPLSVILLLVLVTMGIFLDIRTNGASRWLFGFQPSEIAKLAAVSWTAYLLARFHRNGECAPEAFKPIFVSAGIIFTLIAPENLSTALLLAVVIYLMMLIGCVPWRQMAKLTGGCALVGVIMLTFILTVPPEVYEDVPGTHRFVTWRNRINDYNAADIPPEEYDMEENAQRGHANIAIATSNIWGVGPGNSIQRDWLSHSYSDFVFAITIEELGLAGGAFLVFLYIVLLFRAGRIAKRCEKPYLAFLVMGLALLIVCQAFLHMAVSVGLFPITGQSLPLVSKGGSSLIINCFYIGIIQCVSRHASETEKCNPA